MKVWRWFGALVLVGAFTIAVRAHSEQGTEKPVWKAFDDIKKPFYQEMTTKTNQSMKVSGMEVIQDQSQTFYVEWMPLEYDKEKKTWKVDYSIIGVKMDIKIGGNNISYDSTAKEPAPDNPLTQFFKALVGAKFTFTILNDPNEGPKIIKVDGLSSFVQKLAQTNESLKGLLETILSEEALKQMSNPTFAAFPRTEKEFKEGKWENDVTMSMGPIGSYKTKYTYALRKGADNKVDVTGSMAYTAPKGNDATGLPFTIKSGTLTADKISGTITLDPKNGRIADSTMDMVLTGNLQIEIAGMDTKVDLTQKQTSTLKTMDTNPVPSAAASKK
jgi:Family of unknown function (DUF6263)